MSTRLFVSNLSFKVEKTDLLKLFSPFGKITDIYIPEDRESKKKKGFAFVELSTESQAQDIIERFHNRPLHDRKLIINEAKERGTSSSSSSFPSNSRRPARGNGRKEPHYNENQFINKAVNVIEEIFVPTHTFGQFQLAPALKKNITAHGYKNPTPIQDLAIEPILEGKDLIGLANTGTGKTAAFLLPLITKTIEDKRNRTLIIVPTRELAVQIQSEFKAFAADLRIESVLVIGGANINAQVYKLRSNPHFIIGTPGRIKDLADKKKLILRNCNNIVLDEVDRMLDMGFIEDIKLIIAQLPAERQSLFFSATLPKETDALIHKLLNDPITISVVSQRTAKNVDQDVVRVSSKEDKIEILARLLKQDEFDKVLIFDKTKRNVETLTKNLLKRGFKAISIHGDKSQYQRQKSLDAFKKDQVSIMVATDVAARGLDISDITHVINYSLPASYEDYIHRIGRTGRANKKGKALTFMDQM